MGEAFFYHLQRHSLGETLRMLMEKCRARSWRVGVLAPTEPELNALDQSLWLGADTSFLAHGRAGGAFDVDQPVLLATTADALVNRPECWVSTGGMPLAPEAVDAAERGMILFEAGNPDAVERARTQWRMLTGAGLAAQYWSDASGRWDMKKRHPG